MAFGGGVPSLGLFSAYLIQAARGESTDGTLEKLCRFLVLKKSNEELEATVDTLRTLSEHLEDLNTKLFERKVGPADLLTHPLFGPALEACVKAHPPAALPASPVKKPAPSRPTFIYRQRKISFSKPRTTSKRTQKSGSAAAAGRTPRTRGYCRSIGVKMEPKVVEYMKCVHAGCVFADYSTAKMKLHYLSKHGIDYGDTPLPIYELQLQRVEERRIGTSRRCISCSKTFETDDELSLHTRNVHVPEQFKSRKCECGMKFVLARDLKYHKSICHAE